MTFVRLRCANGDTHIGHLDWWRDGQASIAGHLIDGVVFIDALHRSGGFEPDYSTASASRDHDTTNRTVSSSPAAAPSAGPIGDRPITTTAPSGAEQSSSFGGSSAVSRADTEPRSGRWTCVCGHGRTAHPGWGYCGDCSSCDRFRAKTNEAAAPGRATAS